MSVTNQQIFSELQIVKSSIQTLSETQDKQGKQILDILLKNAKNEGKEEGENKTKLRRKNERIMFWTVLASLATGIGSIASVITLLIYFIPKVG